MVGYLGLCGYDVLNVYVRLIGRSLGLDVFCPLVGHMGMAWSIRFMNDVGTSIYMCSVQMMCASVYRRAPGVVVQMYRKVTIWQLLTCFTALSRMQNVHRIVRRTST